MAFARTHAISDGEVAAFWDNKTKTSKKVVLSRGEAYAPHYPSDDSVVIYAGHEDAVADRQIAKWAAANKCHLQLVKTEES